MSYFVRAVAGLMARVEWDALLFTPAGPALRYQRFRCLALRHPSDMVWIMRRYRVRP